MRILTIQLDDNFINEEIERVQELIGEGFTSGYYPTWELTEDE